MFRLTTTLSQTPLSTPLRDNFIVDTGTVTKSQLNKTISNTRVFATFHKVHLAVHVHKQGTGLR